MKVEVLKEKYVPLWEEYVKSSRNGTIMQLRKFLNYHPPERFIDRSLLIFDSKGHIKAVMPAAEKKLRNEKILLSHPGASHGGIIVGQKTKTTHMLEIIKKIKEYACCHKYDGIEVKMVPRIYHRWPCDEIDYSLRYHGFKVLYTELSTVVLLQNYNEKLVSSTVLRNIRKAVRNGLEVKETTDIKSYWPILKRNLYNRHLAEPTHSFEEIIKLMSLFKGSIKLFAVYKGKKMIAGTVVFILNDRVMNCFYIAQDEKYQALRPLNLLFIWLIKYGRKNGFTYLDWGISTEDKGKKVNEGLFKFKESFSGRGVLRETYRYDLK
ncbi:MAG: GNAT family N-acetyltransferase [Desulfotomaculum sp.]|nr:GNAT family N-acetyltransferase [Desulfotomaculum sp.]